MANRVFGGFSDEIGFEDNPVGKVVSAAAGVAKNASTAVVKQTAQQVKATATDSTNSILDALYGSSTPSTSGEESSPDNTAPIAQPQPQKPLGANQASAQAQGADAHGGGQPQGDQVAKQMADTNLKNIEEGMAKARREREERDRQRLEELEAEAQRAKEAAQQQSQQFIAPGAKGGALPNLSVTQSQTKTEIKSGTSSG